MDWDVIAPMIVAIVLFVTVGGVLILRPLSTRLADLLEAYAADRRQLMGGEVHQIRELLETMNARLQLMEERQDFTERLLEAAKDRGRQEGAGSGGG